MHNADTAFLIFGALVIAALATLVIWGIKPYNEFSPEAVEIKRQDDRGKKVRGALKEVRKTLAESQPDTNGTYREIVIPVSDADIAIEVIQELRRAGWEVDVFLEGAPFIVNLKEKKK